MGMNGNENLQSRYFRITKSHLSYYDSEEISMGNFLGIGKTFCGELPIHDNTIYFTRPQAAAELVVWSGPDIVRTPVSNIVANAPISIKLDDGGMGFHNKGNWAQSLVFNSAGQDRTTWIRELQTQLPNTRHQSCRWQGSRTPATDNGTCLQQSASQNPERSMESNGHVYHRYTDSTTHSTLVLT